MATTCLIRVSKELMLFCEILVSGCTMNAEIASLMPTRLLMISWLEPLEFYARGMNRLPIRVISVS